MIEIKNKEGITVLEVDVISYKNANLKGSNLFHECGRYADLRNADLKNNEIRVDNEG